MFCILLGFAITNEQQVWITEREKRTSMSLFQTTEKIWKKNKTCSLHFGYHTKSQQNISPAARVRANLPTHFKLVVFRTEGLGIEGEESEVHQSGE